MGKKKQKKTQKHSYDTRNSFVTPASDSLSVGLVGAILMASLSPSNNSGHCCLYKILNTALVTSFWIMSLTQVINKNTFHTINIIVGRYR